MSDKDESLRRQLEQARKEVQDAHRVIALLVKKSGGKVSLNVAELTSIPANQALETYEDPGTGAFHIRVPD